MIHGQNTKSAIVILPQSVGTTAVSGTVDTLGYDYATIQFTCDTAAASSVPTTMAVAEGDTTSAYTAITSFTGGTATGNFTMPTPSTSAGDVTKIHIPLTTRKRYLRVQLASTTARLACVTAELGRAEVVPTSDTNRGASEVVYG